MMFTPDINTRLKWTSKIYGRWCLFLCTCFPEETSHESCLMYLYRLLQICWTCGLLKKLVNKWETKWRNGLREAAAFMSDVLAFPLSIRLAMGEFSDQSHFKQSHSDYVFSSRAVTQWIRCSFSVVRDTTRCFCDRATNVFVLILRPRPPRLVRVNGSPCVFETLWTLFRLDLSAVHLRLAQDAC